MFLKERSEVPEG